MSYPIGREESYDSLRPYLPEDGRRILEKEIPRIRKQIDGEIDDFVKSLSAYIKDQAAEAMKEIEADSQKSQAALNGILDDLKKNGTDDKVLTASAEALSKEVEAYKAKWEGLGKSMQKTVLLAAKAAGLPIPSSLG